MTGKNIDIVVLYAPADETYWQELKRHVGLLVRRHPNVALWTVQDVPLGEEVTEQTRQHLHRADITLLLLSADFAADPLLDDETRVLLQGYRHLEDQPRYILPVIVKDFLWQDHYDSVFDLEELKVFQNLPDKAEARESIYRDIAKAIDGYIGYINESPLHFSIPTWVGYIGGITYNRGFARNRKVSLYEQYQRTLRFTINDSKEDICEAFLRGETQIIPATIDHIPYFVHRLREHNPRLIYQASWSNGADAILVRPHVKTLQDLAGKKILYPRHTPAHTFLQYVLRDAGIDYAGINPHARETSDLDELAKEFQADASFDAVVLWSPYLEACREAMPEARVLTDTGHYPNLIADVVLVGEEFLQLNQDELATIFRGWSEEIRKFSEEAGYREQGLHTLIRAIMAPLPSIIPTSIRESLVEALYSYFSQSLDKVHLCSLQDNLDLFGLGESGTAATGKEIYHRLMAIQYPEFVSEPDFQWETLADSSILQALKPPAG